MEICNLLSMLLTVCVFKRVLYELDVSKKNFSWSSTATILCRTIYLRSHSYDTCCYPSLSAVHQMLFDTQQITTDTQQTVRGSGHGAEMICGVNAMKLLLLWRADAQKFDWFIFSESACDDVMISKRCRCAAKKQRKTNCWSRFPTCLLTTKLPRARPSELLVVNVWYIFVLVLIVLLIVYF